MLLKFISNIIVTKYFNTTTPDVIYRFDVGNILHPKDKVNHMPKQTL